MQQIKRKRADAIIKFILNYPGGVLSFHKIEQLAGIGQGTLSHYNNKRPNSGINGGRLKKLEKALKIYGFDPANENEDDDGVGVFG